MDTNEQLITFARWTICEHRKHEGCDMDGESIQDKLEELGLLVRVEVKEPCGENCHCAEYCDEWPVHCLRLADGVLLT